MANLIQLRRSAVASAVPTTAQLALGELAINTFDGKLYLKKNNGTESIVEIGAGGGGATTLDDLTDTVVTTPVLGNVLYYNGTNWVNDQSITNSVTTFNTALSPLSRQTVTTEIKPISVGTTAPSSPSIGDLWVDTN